MHVRYCVCVRVWLYVVTVFDRREACLRETEEVLWKVLKLRKQTVRRGMAAET